MSNFQLPTGRARPVVKLSAGDPRRHTLMVGRLSLQIGDAPVDLELAVPPGPVAAEDLMPVFQGLTNLVVSRGVEKAAASGRTVSCRAGCGACCRQVVPISEPEARDLARVVDAMPAGRQAHVRARFDAALAQLEPTGLLDRAQDLKPEEIAAFGLEWFAQAVACPFLEDEACSIHPDRPLACRQYLVTSPAENCRTPSRETIEMVALPGDPAAALRQASGKSWLPLVVALRVAAGPPAPRRDRTAPEILKDVIGRLGTEAGARSSPMPSGPAS